MTNPVLDPAANGRFGWNGPLPAASGVPGTQIRGLANIEAEQPVMHISSSASVAQIKIANAPPIPAGLKTACQSSPNSALADSCAVVFYKGLAFWPFSYVDNRNAMGLVSYNDARRAVSIREVQGVRYIWSVTSNADKQTVSFNGQGKSTVSIGWAEFK